MLLAADLTLLKAYLSRQIAQRCMVQQMHFLQYASGNQVQQRNYALSHVTVSSFVTIELAELVRPQCITKTARERTVLSLMQHLFDDSDEAPESLRWHSMERPELIQRS